MAGLLDSDLVRFLVSPQSYYANQQQKQGTQQFAGLLGQLQQQGPEQPGQEGLLGMRQPDQQFWLRAAQIPGYQQLASQQLGYDTQGRQAEQREQSSRDWQLNNVTKAQQAQIDQGAGSLQVQKDTAAQNYGLAQRRLALDQASTTQNIAASKANMKLTDIQTQAAEQGLLNLKGPLLSRLPADKQQEGWLALADQDQRVNTMTDVLDYVANKPTGGNIPLLGTSQAAAFDVAWQTATTPLFAEALKTGVINEGEHERLSKLAGDPTAWHLTESDRNALQTVLEIGKQQRDNLYQSYQVRPPELTVGNSVASRALRNRGQLKKPEGLTPVTRDPWLKGAR